MVSAANTIWTSEIFSAFPTAEFAGNCVVDHSRLAPTTPGKKAKQQQQKQQEQLPPWFGMNKTIPFLDFGSVDEQTVKLRPRQNLREHPTTTSMGGTCDTRLALIHSRLVE